MTATISPPRRDFLKTGALAATGLVIGFRLPASWAGQSAATVAPFAPNAFVRIAPTGRVTILVGKAEMGQGVFTSLPMILAEELDADWSKVGFESAPADPAYNHPFFGMQMTGGSTSVWSSFDQLRHAGAMARALLVSAAAQEWKVDAATCRTENSFVIHDATKRRLSYGALAAKAAALPIPAQAAGAATAAPSAEVELKDPKDFKLIGKPTRRLDTPEKTNGAAIFGIDVKRPGMLTAVVARPPVFGGKAKGFNAEKAKAIRGVKAVVEIPRGIAVVADGFWAAKRGRDALVIDWDEGPLAGFSTEKQRSEFAALAKTPGVVARSDGDAQAALRSAAKRIEAEYEVPYLAHATMEPMNCVAQVRPGACDVWMGTQFQTMDQAAAAEEAGLQPQQVKIHTTFLGGGFGRRAVADCHMVREAVQVSRAVKAPVKVIWTREDDTRGGYYRPFWYDYIAAGLDQQSDITSWMHRIVGQSIVAGTPLESAMVKDGIDGTSVEGAADLPYAIANVQVELHSPRLPIPTLWWRSVGHSHTAFVVESFFDELAHAARKDPFELRRALLAKHPRNKRALELAAEKSGWGKPLPSGKGRGIAVHESFGSFVAQVAEVAVNKDGVRVERVVCAVDCGPVVNPDTVKAQMEGGIVFGLTAALKGEITFANGRVQQSNFHDYPMLRMHECPRIEVHIVPSTDKQGGTGEPGVPPIAPALANAVFAATGKRIRRLPMHTEYPGGA